jgi:hypothetical protein
MQLVICLNSPGVNENHQNNMLIGDTSIADVIMPMITVFGCCAFIGLVPPHPHSLNTSLHPNHRCNLWIESNSQVLFEFNSNFKPRSVFEFSFKFCCHPNKVVNKKDAPNALVYLL